MHLLPYMATEADNVLRIFEDVALLAKETQFSFKTDESGTARLVRTAAKVFHPPGVAAYFASYLLGKVDKLKIVSYRGSRFNILFYDAGATYYHRKHIIDFLSSWPNPNNLLKAVAEDMSNVVNQAGIRALGIVNKIITGPYWRVLEAKGNILDLTPYLYQMKLSFDRFEGEILFSDITIHKDEIYNELFRPTNDEVELTIQCLEMIMHSVLHIVERQAEQQLPGGQIF
jgi:E1A/CREB-binding protein